MTMQTSVEMRDDTAIVRLDGAVGILQAKRVEDTFRQLNAQGVRRIIVDVGRLNYVGALAICVVVAGFRTRWPGRAPIEVAALQTRVLEVLVKNHVMTPAGVYASVAEAVAATPSPSPDAPNEN